MKEKVVVRYDRTLCDGELEVLVRSNLSVILRSIRNTVLMLLLTAFFALIPVAHFILVPIGLIATIAIFIMSFGKKKEILKGEGKCPVCEASIEILTHSYRIPFENECESCTKPLVIDKLS